MEEPRENTAEQADTPASTPEVSLGRRLREARERLGLSVADVTGQIKFAPRQIDALEADDFQHLPEMTFVRGFVRSYAKILGLDAQPLLAALPQTKENSAHLTPVSVEVPFPNTQLSQRQNLMWLGAALLLAILGGAFLVWQYLTPDTKTNTTQVEPRLSMKDEAQPAPVSSVPEVSEMPPAVTAARPPPEVEQTSPPVATPPALPQAQSTKPVVQAGVSPQASVLRLAFDEDSWVEIRDRDDKILSSQINPRGSELRLNGQAPFSLVIGHAASVHLYHRGKPVDLTSHISSSNEVARLTLE